MSESKARAAWVVWGLLLAATTAGAVWMMFCYAQVDREQGPMQKMFYVHLPFAINAFAAAMLAFVGGIGYLWQRRAGWDDLSAAAASAAALTCTVVLATGMIWGRYAWGKWWDWSPRLTFSLLLWLLYVVYLILRPSIESRQRRAMVCAVYAVAAFLDVPLVYLSSKLMNDIHPKSITLATTEMKLTLAAWFVPVTLLIGGLVTAWTVRAARRRQRIEAASAEAAWSLEEEEGNRQ
jgi:heme exporter protein C